MDDHPTKGLKKLMVGSPGRPSGWSPSRSQCPATGRADLEAEEAPELVQSSWGLGIYQCTKKRIPKKDIEGGRSDPAFFDDGKLRFYVFWEVR